MGLGPSGQLRFPSYKNSAFCGVGQFMDADRFAKNRLRSSLSADLTELLKNDSTDTPRKAPFFRTKSRDACSIMSEFKSDCGHPGISQVDCKAKGCCYAEVDGDAYCYAKEAGLEVDPEKTIAGRAGQELSAKYSEELLAHADRVLAVARRHLFFVRLGMKLSAVHWTAGSVNRAPEATTGYFVGEGFNFYASLMELLARHKVMLTISGIEMSNNVSRDACYSRAKDLVAELKALAKQKQVELMGENAWERSDVYALDTIADNAEGLTSINFLRLTALHGKNQAGRAEFQRLVERLSDVPATTHYQVISQALTSFQEFDCDECKSFSVKQRLLIL